MRISTIPLLLLGATYASHAAAEQTILSGLQGALTSPLDSIKSALTNAWLVSPPAAAQPAANEPEPEPEPANQPKGEDPLSPAGHAHGKPDEPAHGKPDEPAHGPLTNVPPYTCLGECPPHTTLPAVVLQPEGAGGHQEGHEPGHGHTRFTNPSSSCWGGECPPRTTLPMLVLATPSPSPTPALLVLQPEAAGAHHPEHREGEGGEGKGEGDHRQPFFTNPGTSCWGGECPPPTTLPYGGGECLGGNTALPPWATGNVEGHKGRDEL